MSSDIPINYVNYPIPTPRGSNWLSEAYDLGMFMEVTDGDDRDRIPDDGVMPDGDGVGL